STVQLASINVAGSCSDSTAFVASDWMLSRWLLLRVERRPSIPELRLVDALASRRPAAARIWAGRGSRKFGFGIFPAIASKTASKLFETVSEKAGTILNFALSFIDFIAQSS